MKRFFSSFFAIFLMAGAIFLTSCTEYSSQLQAKSLLTAPDAESADPAIVYATTSYTDDVQTGTLWVMNADGTHKTAIYSAPSTKSASALVGVPTWSPDGKRIAFTQSTSGYEDGSVNGLFIGDMTIVNGKPTMQNKRLLVPGVGLGMPIAWDPNSSADEIAYIGISPENSAQAIKIVSAAGSASEVLYTAPADHTVLYPSYSPDGSQIAFEDIDNSSATAKYSIVIIDRATRTVQEKIAIPSMSALDHPQWCHTIGSTQIAFGAAFSEGTCGIFTVDAENPNAPPMQVLTPSAGYCSMSASSPFAWSPNDSVMLIGNISSGEFGMLNINDGRVSTLASTSDGISQFDWRRY